MGKKAEIYPGKSQNSSRQIHLEFALPGGALTDSFRTCGNNAI